MGQARRLVNDYLTRHKQEFSHTDTARNSDEDLSSRQQLLLERTLSISAIYLGDERAASDYLRSLLADPLSDDLNRGFHLEYYQDAPRLPEAGGLDAKDDLKCPPVKTFEVLQRKLYADLRAKKCRAMTPIELQTLCSLCVSRHTKGLLSEHHRVRLLGLIRSFRNEDQIILPREIAPYLDMVEHIVGQHRVSVGSLFCELHAVKARVRAGWNVVHEIDGKKYSRECVNPESVSDHIFGCILIAEVFLPESDLVHNEYSKNEVIRMLTIHDLSETYTGDVPFFRKTADDELKEKQLMRRTISLGTVPGFRGILGWKSVWERWSRKETLNAQIAHDIDRIENYVQLMQYLRRSEPRCIIEDAKQWAAGIDLRLETDLGKEIFASLRHRGTELLKWFKDEQLP